MKYGVSWMHILSEKCWRMVRVLLATWNVDFALVDEREKNIMQEE